MMFEVKMQIKKVSNVLNCRDFVTRGSSMQGKYPGGIVFISIIINNVNVKIRTNGADAVTSRYFFSGSRDSLFRRK
jgi:hypothetical protein